MVQGRWSNLYSQVGVKMSGKIRLIAFVLGLTLAGRPAGAQIITPTTQPLSSAMKELQRGLRAERATRERLAKAAGIAGADKASQVSILTSKAASALSIDERRWVDAANSVKALEAKVAQEANDPASTAPKNTFLTQAGFEGATGTGHVTLDAATLYFKGGKSRLYVRSTLPTTPAVAEEKDDDGLDGQIKSALNDPYGGLLYLAAGGMVPLNADPADSSRGLFLDFRAGAKFVQLPEKLSETSYRVTPFLVWSGGLRLSEPLSYDADGLEPAGRLDASVSFVVNRVLDRTVSALFTADDKGNVALATATRSVNVALGLTIKENIGLVASGTAWSSSHLDRRFVLGVTLLK